MNRRTSKLSYKYQLTSAAVVIRIQMMSWSMILPSDRVFHMRYDCIIMNQAHRVRLGTGERGESEAVNGKGSGVRNAAEWLHFSRCSAVE
jgi:hypothetical protein